MQAVLVKAFSNIKIPINVTVDTKNQEKLEEWFDDYEVGKGIKYTLTQAQTRSSLEYNLFNA